MGHALDVPRGFTEPGFEFLLQALAFHGGNTRRTVKALEQMDEAELREFGIDKIPHFDTINRWKTRHAERYAAIRNDKVIAAYRQRAAEAHNAHADDELEVSSLILQRLRENVHQLDPRDLAGALRNTDTGAAINRDKALALVGDSPGSVQINLNITEQIRGLAAKGVPLYDENNQPLTPEQAIARATINGTATELPKETESVES